MPIDLDATNLTNLPLPDIRDDGILQYSFKQANRREDSKRPPKLRPANVSRYSPSSSLSTSAHIISFRQDGGIEKDEMPQSFSYDSSLSETYFEQSFTNLAKIGEGSFGEVFKVRSKDDGLLYAVKMSKQYLRSEQYRQERLEEVRRYEEFSGHANCVRFYRAWEQDDRLYMQMELYRENLERYLERKRNIPEEKIWSILLDLLLALESLHSRNLIHLDIKLENVLIGDDGTCKLGDFGLVIDIMKTNRACEGDSRYMAPEIMQGNFSQAADIFSLGIAILELSCCLELPSNGPLWQQLRKGVLPEAFIKSKSNDLQTVIRQMMAPNPADRPTAQQLLSHKKIVVLLRRRNRWKLLRIVQRSLRKTRRLAWSRICKAQRMLRNFLSRMVASLKAHRAFGFKSPDAKLLKARLNTSNRKANIRVELTTSTPTSHEKYRTHKPIMSAHIPNANGNASMFLDTTPPLFIENEVINSTPLMRKNQSYRSRKDLEKTIFDLLEQMRSVQPKTPNTSSLDQSFDTDMDLSRLSMRKSFDSSSLQGKQLFSYDDDDL